MLRDKLHNIQENYPLAEFTTYHIGGPAKYFFDAVTDEDVVMAVQAAKEAKMQYFILGGGTNILVSDAGFDGLVIRMNNAVIDIQGTKVRCGAGTLLPDFVQATIERSLSGLELLSGIGGTVGGAIRGNAGAFGKSIGDCVTRVWAFENGAKREFSKQECGFEYRTSVFKRKNILVISAELELEKGNGNELARLSRETVQKREKRYDPRWKSAGCVFKNIDLSLVKIDEDRVMRALDVTEGEYREATKHGKLPVSFIVDKLGLKGKKIGGAQVANEHGAFILNVNNATSDHVIQLISYIKMMVRDKLGIQLEEEIQLVGF